VRLGGGGRLTAPLDESGVVEVIEVYCDAGAQLRSAPTRMEITGEIYYQAVKRGRIAQRRIGKIPGPVEYITRREIGRESG
jgi:hypothetical protein